MESATNSESRLGTVGKSLLDRGRNSLLPRVVPLGGAEVRKSLIGVELEVDE